MGNIKFIDCIQMYKDNSLNGKIRLNMKENLQIKNDFLRFYF
jgi:hypothetical protein